MSDIIIVEYTTLENDEENSALISTDLLKERLCNGKDNDIKNSSLKKSRRRPGSSKKSKLLKI
jgi:hypothetical protein